MEFETGRLVVTLASLPQGAVTATKALIRAANMDALRAVRITDGVPSLRSITSAPLPSRGHPCVLVLAVLPEACDAIAPRLLSMGWVVCTRPMTERSKCCESGCCLTSVQRL